MAIVNKFNVNREQVTLDADIIENMSANDISYNSSLKYDENTVGDKLNKLSELEGQTDKIKNYLGYFPELEPIFKVGGLSISTNGWGDMPSDTRVSSKKESPIYLTKGSVVKCTLNMYVGGRIGSTYITSGAWVKIYNVPEDGYYVFNLEANGDIAAALSTLTFEINNIEKEIKEQIDVVGSKVNEVYAEINGVDLRYSYKATSGVIDIVLADIDYSVGKEFIFEYDGTAAMTSSTQRNGTTNFKNTKINKNEDGTYTQIWEKDLIEPSTTVLRYYVNIGDTIIVHGKNIKGLKEDVSELKESADVVDYINKEVNGYTKTFSAEVTNGTYINFSDFEGQEDDVVIFHADNGLITQCGLATAEGVYLNNITPVNLGNNDYKVVLTVLNESKKGTAAMLRFYTSGKDRITISKQVEGLVDKVANIKQTLYNPFIKNICHRGYSLEAPDDTEPAYVFARNHGYEYVETDMWFTSDGIPVIVHNPDLSVETDGTGKVNEVTYDYFKSITVSRSDRFGTKYANLHPQSFDECFATLKKLGLKVYIDVKAVSPLPSGTENAFNIIIPIVRKYGMENAVTWICAPAVARMIRQVSPNARVTFMASSPTDMSGEIDALISQSQDLIIEGKQELTGIDAAVTYLTKSDVDRVHDAGMFCDAWLADGSIGKYPEKIVEYVNLGIDGFTNDGCDLARVILDYYVNMYS